MGSEGFGGHGAGVLMSRDMPSFPSLCLVPSGARCTVRQGKA